MAGKITEAAKEWRQDGLTTGASWVDTYTLAEQDAFIAHMNTIRPASGPQGFGMQEFFDDILSAAEYAAQMGTTAENRFRIQSLLSLERINLGKTSETEMKALFPGATSTAWDAAIGTGEQTRWSELKSGAGVMKIGNAQEARWMNLLEIELRTDPGSVGYAGMVDDPDLGQPGRQLAADKKAKAAQPRIAIIYPEDNPGNIDRARVRKAELLTAELGL